MATTENVDRDRILRLILGENHQRFQGSKIENPSDVKIQCKGVHDMNPFISAEEQLDKVGELWGTIKPKIVALDIPSKLVLAGKYLGIGLFLLGYALYFIIESFIKIFPSLFRHECTIWCNHRKTSNKSVHLNLSAYR